MTLHAKDYKLSAELVKHCFRRLRHLMVDWPADLGALVVIDAGIWEPEDLYESLADARGRIRQQK